MNARRVAKGLYALWYREFKVFTRERSRVISSIVTPLFFMLILGGGLGPIVNLPGVGYQTFIYPGFLAMIVLFTSVFFGTYVVWDKKIDFLKEVLISPVGRATIFTGKVLGGVTDAMIQVSLLMLVGVFLGIPFNLLGVVPALFMLLLFAAGMVSLGLVIGSFMESPQGFGLIGSLIIFPMFLLSGALYPLESLPSWMAVLTHVNPVTYAVDGLRDALLGASSFPFIFDISMVSTFSIIMIVLGTWSFNRMKV